MNLERDLHGTKKLLYSLAKNYRGKRSEGAYAIKDKECNLFTQPEKIRTRWKEYFNELLNVENDFEVIQVPEEELSLITMKKEKMY